MLRFVSGMRYCRSRRRRAASGMMDIYAVYAAIEPPEDSVTAELTLHGGKTWPPHGAGASPAGPI